MIDIQSFLTFPPYHLTLDKAPYSRINRKNESILLNDIFVFILVKNTFVIPSKIPHFYLERPSHFNLLIITLE